MTQQPFGFMLPEDGWQPPSLSSLPSWRNAKRVAIDVETKDPQLTKLGPGVRRDGRIIGVSFAIADGPAAYLPVAHEGGGNLPEAAVFEYLKDQVKAFRGLGTELVGANLGYDLDYLWEYGVKFEPGYHRDVQVAEPLIDEIQFSYSLNNIAKRHNILGKNEESLKEAASAFGVNPKKEMFKLPSKFVGRYAERDTRLPLQLLELQHRQIEDQGLWRVYNMESELLPVLVDMRRRGVPVDLKRLQEISDWSEQQELEACDRIYAKTGVRINLNEITKDSMVVHALTAAGITLTETTAKGKISTSADILNAIDSDVCRAIIRARKFNKLRGTFVRSIFDHQINGRVHCSFNQLKSTNDEGTDKGTVSGRLSSSDPNLQQQPARDPEIGPRWRSIYRPEDGELWACNDYSQQEPRWTVDYAEQCGLPGARDAADRYRNDPTTDSHTMMTKIINGDDVVDLPEFKQLRSEAKQVFLGVSYGMGGPKLCRGLGYSTDWKKSKKGKWYEVAGPEGQAVIDKFNRNAPFIQGLARRVEAAAAQRGFICTALGRRCRFPWDHTGKNRDWTHKALNRLIQGTSADQTKVAMLNAHKAGVPLMLQVHDEIDFSTPSREYAEEVATIMREAIPTRVPAKVDVEIGPSWGEVK